jgi:hypothetical protein
VVAQGVRESEISMELKTKIMALIEEGWDRNRPPGGVGTTDSATIYTRLLAEGVDVPPGAMAQILRTCGLKVRSQERRRSTQKAGSYTVPGRSLSPSGGCDVPRATKALVA